MSGSPSGGTDFVDTDLVAINWALWFSCLGRVRRSGRDNVGIVNKAVHGRRLCSPVRLALAIELGAPLDGGWWPHTAALAHELPELIDALSLRLGEIIAISVNWSSLEGSPDLDALGRATTADPDRIISHQRLMMVTGSQASANLLVVPCRTSSALAVMVLRQAAALPVLPIEMETKEFRVSNDIVQAARAESAACACRLRPAGFARVEIATPAITV